MHIEATCDLPAWFSYLRDVFAEPNAPSNVHASTATVSSVTVEWTAATSGAGSTYTVTLKDGDTVKETTTGITGTTTDFNSLTAGKQYTAVVVSVNGNQSSDPVQGIVYTSKSEMTSSHMQKTYRI